MNIKINNINKNRLAAFALINRYILILLNN